MAQQTLIWTTLPNGYSPDGKYLRLSVMLSPRLNLAANEQKKLSSFFPDWEDWPSVLQSARFNVRFNGKTISINYTTTGQSRIDGTIGLADSTAWKAMFNGELPVIPHAYTNLSSRTVLSYDTVLMENKIKNTYQTLAKKANGNMPLVRDFLQDSDWIELIETIDSLDQQYANQDTGLRNPLEQFQAYRPPSAPRIALLPVEEPKPELENFDHFQLFHTPSGKPEPFSKKRPEDHRIEPRWLENQRQELPQKENLAKQLDFHQIVSTMGSYPTLLRKVGLVVDLLLDPKGFDVTADGELSVTVTFPPNQLTIQTKNSSPVTRAQLSQDRFQAISAPNAASSSNNTFQIENGLLKLEPTQFELLQLDVDSAGLKLMNFLRSLGRKRDSDSPGASSSSSSSSGSVVKVRSLVLGGQSNGNNRVNPVTRHEDEAGAPSLRTGGLMLVHKNRKDALTNRFSRNTEHNSALEGTSGNLSLFAEDLIRGYRIDIWDSKTRSWHSLCLRRASYLLGDEVVKVDVNSEETTIRLAATKPVDPKSDISDFLYLHEIMASWAGWSLAAPPPGRVLSPDDSVDKTQVQSEAEIPPGLKFKSTFKPVPNSLPRLRFGRSYWIRARAVDLAGNSLAPQSKDFGPEQPAFHAVPYLRFEPVAAPIVALLSQNGGIEQPAEGESMACIAIRSFNDTTADNTVPTSQIAHRAVVPPRVSVREAEQHGKLDLTDGKLDTSAFDLLANQKDIDPRDARAAVREVKISSQGPLESNPTDTTYAVYEGGRQLTYLPDPLALEAAVSVFDHPNIAEAEIITIPLYPTGEWPEAQPFVIEVYDNPTDKPHFDANRRVLRVPLPKAVRAKIRMSMKLASDDLDKMAIFALLEATDKDTQRDRALDGQHWMLTPWHVVEVVHAVQRPLIAPEMQSLSIQRDSGSTSARPVIVSSCSVRSTDRLDLLGEWHEPLDDADLPESPVGPADRRRQDIAFSIKITDAKNYATRLNGLAAGGFPDHTINNSNENVIGVNDIKDSRLTVKTHEFYDTRYRRIEYWFDATTRFREFLPNDLLTAWEGNERVPVETYIKVTGARAVTWVPNSGPPPAPKVLYIVPTFGWVRTTDSEYRQLSWRRGGGLRVYLDRPWNVSGYGEMLGVVLPPTSFTGNPDKEPVAYPYKKYVTQWGNDPIWDSPFVSGIAPTRDNFPLARYAPDTSGDWLPPGAPETEKDQKPGSFKVTGLYPPMVSTQTGSSSSSSSTTYGAEIEVAPHDVFYDAERQLWYCDIEIEAGASYFPFVRLALARYQPTSTTGAHLSNIVLADFMALSVDRWLVVMPTSTDVTSYQVAVFGVGFKESSAHHEAVNADPTSVLNLLIGQSEELKPTTVAESNVIEVWVEKLDPRLGGDFGWQRVADVAVTPQPPEDRGLTFPDFGSLAQDRLTDVIRSWKKLWEGDVVLPTAPNECDRYRLVIAEYEEYLIDDDQPYDSVPTRKDRRLVYVEHVELM